MLSLSLSVSLSLSLCALSLSLSLSLSLCSLSLSLSVSLSLSLSVLSLSLSVSLSLSLSLSLSAVFLTLQVVAPALCLAKVSEAVAVDVAVGPADGQQASLMAGQPCDPPECFEGVVTPIVPRGYKPFELAYRLDTPTGACVLSFTDALFHITAPEHQSVVGRWVFDATRPLHVARMGRWFALASAQEVAAWLRDLAEGRGAGGAVPRVPDAILVAHTGAVCGRAECQRLLEYAAADLGY